MADEIKLGAEIKIDGKRPEWLNDDEKIGIVWRHGERWDNLDTEARHMFGWEDSVVSIMLRADHPYYTNTITLHRLTHAAAYEDGLDIPTLEKLGLIREETTFERFEKAYGFMTTRERDTVKAFIEWQDGFSA